MALVAGISGNGFWNWKDWLYVAKGLPRRLTDSLSDARLFSVTPQGYRAADLAACATRDITLGRGLDGRRAEGPLFLARVVVTGDWFYPFEVIEAWRFESRQPTKVQYPFETGGASAERTRSGSSGYLDL
jgi:hypothetical protein